METDEAPRVLPFQLQFDKPLASQIKIAVWNPEKDLLAMVTEDSKLILHRFNWQRLWTISPGRCITSLCWRPDGKVIAVGLEDGNISLHDVENGKLLRSLKSHTDAVVSLNWVEDEQPIKDNSINILTYEDRTSRFFPPAPRVPRRPGFVSGDTGFVDDSEDSFHELSSYSYQRSNILCSGDKRGSICFSIFGIFPVGKINIQEMSIPSLFGNMKANYRLQNASIHRVALSTDFRHLIVMCTGQLSQEDGSRQKSELSKLQTNGSQGLHCLKLDTTIFERRKNELHQLAQQASNVEDLIEVIRASLSVMCKQWTDAMHLFHEKFDPLSSLIVDHGLESSPQEEFLSLLGGARTSPPIHQFLVNSLGEVGLKRISKVVCGAGKELQNIVLDHLQPPQMIVRRSLYRNFMGWKAFLPLSHICSTHSACYCALAPAAEIIGFRMGELQGLSRWRAHYKGIGLDETLINDATEMSGMFLAQVERFMMLLSSVVLQFSNFFNWLLKCVKILMQEASDQLLPYNSELVVIFLKLLYDQDPVRMFLDPFAVDYGIEIDAETMQRNEELIQFGGFSNCDYLRRTLEKEFQLMESSLKEAFHMPFTTVSQKIICEAMLPLFPLASSLESMPAFPLSVSYYKDGFTTQSTDVNYQQGLNDYISFRIPDDSFSDIRNCIGVFRGFTSNLSSTRQGSPSLEATWLSLPHGYECVDLCLYKERQIVLLLNETTTASDGTGESCLMVLQASDLPFVPISGSISPNHWNFDILKGSVVYLERENEKVRAIPHAVVAPLAVSASRGVACIFAAKRRALVYILDEDEDEVTDTE